MASVLWDTKYAYEILFVDDGSTDSTPDILDALMDPHVKVIHLARNFGQQIAITAGLDAATGDAIIILDADMQDPPELIPQMLGEWEKGAHIVYGRRLSRERETWLKKSTAKLYYRLLNRITDTSLPLDAGDFRLMDRQVVVVLRRMREHNRYLRGMSAWVGLRYQSRDTMRSNKKHLKKCWPSCQHFFVLLNSNNQGTRDRHSRDNHSDNLNLGNPTN
ncbi:Glycosyl transferase family 2 [Acididesulfobacillus acetoxydans]|uniref:Bactoprenol glucosyl transferase homolog from prophage CPS-53 n=1 Tax=Acididesulfobacillus acetoxydans TaxID=1561005 RepID=A0A8S0W6A5_9FIRM|nr:Glycosyl transferase family 2 [Acididesulfobacillus acetoxydans]CEJ06221.1 Bactoprenol glucosyl transferase homolog from prophage CPS-53 [Acididesulfobacillus acetoxydans]